MSQWVFIAIVFGLSQLTLALLLLCKDRPRGQQQWFFVGFLLATAAYLLDPLLSGPVTDFVLLSLTGFVPCMYFLFSASLFDDNFKLRSMHFFAVAIVVLPPMLAGVLRFYSVNDWDWLLIELPQWLEFLLLAYALYIAVRYWGGDLVAQRRQLRIWFSGVTGVYITLLIVLRELIMPGSAALESFQFASAALVLLFTNVLLLNYQSNLWASSGLPSRADATASDAVSNDRRHQNRDMVLDDAPDGFLVNDHVDAVVDKTPSIPVAPSTLKQIRQLMDEAHIYREMGLTLGKLAEEANIPAYKLREAINRGLGFRNFNDFLNSYRIEEAAARLRDKTQEDIQILVIALDAGFRSLSSFNKAFRQALGATPTEYRKSQLG